MNASDLKKAISEVHACEAVLLDVRTPKEYAAEHAVGAVCFDLGRLMGGELPPVGKTDPIYVYCLSGARSGRAKGILEVNGYRSVRNLGPLANWRAGGGPVEAGGEPVRAQCHIEI